MFTRKNSVASFVLVTAFFAYGSVGCAERTSSEDIGEDEAALEMGSVLDGPTGAVTGAGNELGTVRGKPSFATKGGNDPKMPSYLDDQPMVAQGSEGSLTNRGGRDDEARVLGAPRNLGDLRSYGDEAPMVTGSDVDIRSVKQDEPNAVYGARRPVGDLRGHGNDAPMTTSPDTTFRGLNQDATNAVHGAGRDIGDLRGYGGDRPQAGRGSDEIRNVRPGADDARVLSNEAQPRHEPESLRRVIPAPVHEGTAPTSCYDDRTPPAISGGAPRIGSGRCSASEIRDMAAACIPHAGSFACEQLVAANPACGACVMGSSDREMMAAPVGVVYPTRHGQYSVNTISCAAMMLAKPECAAPLAVQDACLEAACPVCTTPGQKAACLTQAASGICAASMAPACTAAVEQQRAKWEPKCIGATAAESFERVATLFCGK